MKVRWRLHPMITLGIWVTVGTLVLAGLASLAIWPVFMLDGGFTDS